MKTHPLFEPESAAQRKRPVQDRSGQTVERIKLAMQALISEQGYSSVSTNRIAKRAGVNIASLYRYFPNRQAIALAMYEDASSRLAQLVHEQMLASMTLPLAVGVTALIDRLVDFMDQEQMALLRLIDEVPELRDSAAAMSLENLAYHSSRVYLEQHLGKLEDEQMLCKMFFVQHLSMGLLRQYVALRPAGLDKRRFVSELSELIMLYLNKPLAQA